MSENPLLEVRRLGQSVWLDDIRRGWLESGELKRLIDEDGLAETEQVLAELAEAGIDIDRVTRQLEKEGVQKFNEPFDLLMETLDRKREELLREPSA